MTSPASKPKKPRVNVRRPDVMELVSAEVARHYHSSIVESIRNRGGKMTIGNTTVLLAEQFGFCYGVERAIDLAYASRRVFPDDRIFLIGEIIHNPDVNSHLAEMDIVSLPWQEISREYEQLTEHDVVIIPAFGAPTDFMDKVESKGCRIIDTTCGDVMKVWRRVRGYAKDGITSIIHGKAGHEETRATASRALGTEKNGHYLVILTLEDTEYLCSYLASGGVKEEFLQKFDGAFSPGFDPDIHLQKVGVANQTTMLKSETEEIQRRIRKAIELRDGNAENFHMFDTICGATQERQDALFSMLDETMDLMLVIGGYNSSNTSHLVEISEKSLPTFFIRGASCIQSFEDIIHFDIHQNKEVKSSYAHLFSHDQPITVGVTAGASCPNNLIEDSIVRVLQLRGVPPAEIKSFASKDVM